MYINFTNPSYLAFLFLIPVLIFFHFYGLKNIKGKSLKFANFEAIARIKGIDLYSKNLSVLLFNIFLIVLLVLALAGLTVNKSIEGSSFSFVIAVDSSNSMSAKDMEPDRISAAKETAINFIDSLPFESYAGVVSFSGDSKTEQELTKNKQQLRNSISNIEISNTGGTDIYEAVVNSIRLLKEEENKAIILLSDGQINVGDIQSIVEYTDENKAIIHTIGIGSIEGGETSFGISKLDENSLKSLAYNTGGKFFNAKNNKELEESFAEIINVTEKEGSFELSPYLIIIVIILFIIKEFLISINKIIW